eukprot:1429171-Pyramimonas_sp.AAC.2
MGGPHLEDALGGEHDVGRLDVAVHNQVAVEVLQRQGHLEEHLQRELLLQVALARQLSALALQVG